MDATKLLFFLRNLQADITAPNKEPRRPSKRALRLLNEVITTVAGAGPTVRPISVTERGSQGDNDPIIEFSWTEPRGCSETTRKTAVTPEAAAQVVHDLMQFRSVRDFIF